MSRILVGCSTGTITAMSAHASWERNVERAATDLLTVQITFMQRRTVRNLTNKEILRRNGSLHFTIRAHLERPRRHLDVGGRAAHPLPVLRIPMGILDSSERIFKRIFIEDGSRLHPFSSLTRAYPQTRSLVYDGIVDKEKNRVSRETRIIHEIEGRHGV